MRVSIRAASMSTLFAAMLAITVASASAASPTTRWVDDDGHAGPGGCGGAAAAATTIQAGVMASHAGDTVIVCPGSYTEQIRIHGSRDGLTLRSATPFGAVIRTPTSLTGSGIRALLVIDNVNDVTVRGFKALARTQAPCDSLDVAFAAIGSKGVAFRGNRVLAPGAGDTADCQLGVGIGITDRIGDTGPAVASSGVIGFNEVRDSTFAGIIAVGQSKFVNLDAVQNSVRAYFGDPPAGGSAITDGVGGQFGILYVGHVRGTVRGNVAQGSSGAPASGAAFYAGIGVANGFDSGEPANVNGPIDIRDNLVRRVGNGIYLVKSHHVTVRHNQVSNTVFGLVLEGAQHDSIRGNTIRTKAYGLYLDSATLGNVVRGNAVGGVGGVCIDVSTGGGTAGTANTWAGNTASVGSSPTGICAVAP
jgi:hypothetical protein